MRSGTGTTRRVRLVLVLAVAAAVTVMIGAILVAVGPVMRMVTKRQPAHLTRLGLDVIAAGIAFGLMVLLVFAVTRIGRAGRRRLRTGGTGHRRGAARHDPAAATAGHDGAARSGRPPVLNPTNVYSPGGLIDVPRGGPGPRTSGGEDIPEILRTAGPGPAPGASVPRSRPQRHGYPPGMNPGGPGRTPYGPGGQPVPPMPPRDHGRPREAPRSWARP